MKLLKRKPKLIIEFEDDEEKGGFYITVKTQGDMCDQYVVSAADYLNKSIKACRAKKNGKNGRK